MKKGLFCFAVLGALLFLLAVGLQPALAGSTTTAGCSQVDFYLTSTVDAAVFYDVANWSTADRALGYIYAGEEHRFSLPPGVFEYWLTDNETWDLDEWVYLPACSRAAAYVKLVNGREVLKIKVFLPGGD